MNATSVSPALNGNTRVSVSAPSLAQSNPVNHALRSSQIGDSPTPVLKPAPENKNGLRTSHRVVLGIIFIATAVAAVRFSYDWWTVGRFAQTTDDA